MPDYAPANSGKEIEMTANAAPAPSPATASSIAIAINILTSPAEAFRALEPKPTKLFPLAVVLASSVIVLFWYFTIIDFDWYVDDTLAANANLTAEQLEVARDRMLSMSQSTFRLIGMAGSLVSVLLLYVVQAVYLTMVSALSGDKYRFSHWFSLISWTNLPYLLAVIGMADHADACHRHNLGQFCKP